MTIWIIDPERTDIRFSVAYMMVSTVTGQFQQFSGTIRGDAEQLTTASIQFSIDIASICTNSKERDEHLCSKDFFHAETYPRMKFVSTSILQNQDGSYAVAGNLTIKQTTKKITFCAFYEGRREDESGKPYAEFNVTGKLKRKDFGLTWNRALEAGGVLVGDDVEIVMHITATPE